MIMLFHGEKCRNFRFHNSHKSVTAISLNSFNKTAVGLTAELEISVINRGVKSREISPENLLLSLTMGTKHSQCPVALGSCFVFC